jgi:hypothetical protein
MYPNHENVTTARHSMWTGWRHTPILANQSNAPRTRNTVQKATPSRTAHLPSDQADDFLDAWFSSFFETSRSVLRRHAVHELIYSRSATTASTFCRRSVESTTPTYVAATRPRLSITNVDGMAVTR